MRKEQQAQTAKLIEAIIEGLHRLKGRNIVLIDLNKIHGAECNYFVICHGTSNTQVDALARSVQDTVKELTGEQAWHTDGYRNAQWILLDYLNIMVHVFQEETRGFYDLEGLWADADIKQIESEN